MIHVESPNWTFIHVYKTGGHGILASLISAGVGCNHILHQTAHESSALPWWNRDGYQWALIRMPYDWIVSQFYFLCETPDHWWHGQAIGMTLPEFVERYHREYPERRRLQGHFVRERENLSFPLVGNLRLFRYDEPALWWPEACRHLGTPGIPLQKNNITKYRPHWASVIKRETRRRIDAIYSSDWEIYESARGEIHTVSDTSSSKTS
jgi:hypothetical protein